MKDIKKISFIALAAMAAISFFNLFGLPIAGLTVPIGVVFFFLDKGKTPFAQSGLGFKGIGKALSDKRIWFWLASPLLMNIVALGLAKLIMPEFIDHVLARTAGLLSFNKIALLTVQLAVFAVLEEIAWRAFFQDQLHKAIPAPLAVLFSSVLFGLAHVAAGNPAVVIYDVFFVIVNSCLYGVIFHKTNNAWVSAIAHFAANLFSVIVLL